MENPNTWGKVKCTIASAMAEHRRMIKQKFCGASDVSVVYNALRKAGYVVEDVPLTEEERIAFWNSELEE